MKIIVAGSRTFNDYNRLSMVLQTLYPETATIVSGTARGADALGERFATTHNWPLIRVPADWNTHGRSAGYKRNETMAMLADRLVAFWDRKSRGTKHMIDIMDRLGKPADIFIF
jgi:hypothetical protein